MNIKPIRNDADHEAALAKIEKLWNAEEGTPDADTLEVLAILVEDYENKRWPVPQVAPLEVLRYAVTEMGRSQSELAELLGSRSRASELLNGKRQLTIEAVRKISSAWSISAELLVGRTECESAA